MVYCDFSGLKHWWQRGATWAHRGLLPPRCIACGEPCGGVDAAHPQVLIDLCTDCTQDLPFNTPACPCCALPLDAVVDQAQLCGVCLRRAPPYAACYCAFQYAFPMDHFVRALKFAQALGHARVLAHLLAVQLQTRPSFIWPECFIPVPLSRERYRVRGYNQTIELGRFLATAIAVPMRTDLVWRVRDTVAQSGLSQRERRKNVRGAFAVTHQVLPRRVALLDDVVTTGSTVGELTRVLQRAGVEQVEVWAVARVSTR